jgi:outer membrane receptor protein involved in Fe transport
MRLKVLLLAAAAMLSPSLVLAQTAPAPAPKAAATAVEGVTVTSDSTAMRTSIDRRSYSVAKDLSAQTGSISDALRNIPSVEVDVQGNVSLRGDPNVTILIDGKPSSMFNGEGKADALQQMPADRIDRVEVMTNPSAAYRPDGTAGIINLITKKTRKPGATGSFKLNVGPDGRYNTGVSGNRVKGKLTLSGDASYRFDRQTLHQLDERDVGGVTGADREVVQDSAFKNVGGAASLRGGIDYTVSQADRVSGEVRYRDMRYSTGGVESYAEYGYPEGVQGPAYDRDSASRMQRRNSVVSGDWRHQFKGSEHELTTHLEYEATDFHRHVGALVTSQPDGTERRESSRADADQDRVNLKVDYTRPLGGQAKLKTGLDLETSRNDYTSQTDPGFATGIVTDGPANRFIYDQDVYAAYATYERPIGDFTALAGLRLEQVDIHANQVGYGLKSTNAYFRAYPTLHLAYTLTSSQSLSASYSRRVQRPQVQDLNPYRTYIDQYNYRSGNPDLEPQVTDSYELGWQYRSGPASYLATAYFRDSTDVVTDVVTDLSNGVLLTTRDNLGKSRNGGLELVANGKLTPKLSYNVSGNAFWNEIDAGNLGFSGTRSGTTLSGRASLNWQATPKDFFQLNGFTSGKRLTPQGHRQPISLLNLGYRRKVSDRLNFVVTANDVLKSFKDVAVVESPNLSQRTERTANVRAVFFGFTYGFGGGKARPEQFDFGSGAVGG